MISKSPVVLVIAILPVASSLAHPLEPNQSDDRAAVETFTRKFLRASENLDMQQFIACFVDNATMFFPMPEPPERVEGRQAIQQRFERVFASIRSTAKSGAPFHHLVPEDLAIQLMPGRTAVVSFHLRNSERIARRSLVLTNERAMAHLPSAPFQRSDRRETRSLGWHHSSERWRGLRIVPRFREE